MGVKIYPFLELPGRVKVGEGWNVRYYSREHGEITVITPRAEYGTNGILYVIPNGLRPHRSDWKFRVHVFDGVPALVCRGNEIMNPRKETAKDGTPYEKYSGRADELKVEYPDGEEFVALQPVMFFDRASEGYRRDLRRRLLASPTNERFLEAAREYIQRQSLSSENGNEADDPTDEDHLSREEAANALQAYRTENPLGRKREIIPASIE